MTTWKKLLILIGDIVLLYGALAATLLIRYGTSDFNSRLDAHVIPFSTIFALWLAIFYISDLYDYRTLRNEGKIAQSILWPIILAGLISAVVFYLFGDFFLLTPKTNLAIFGAVFLVLSYFWRVFLSNTFSTGAWGVGILGDSPLIDETIAHVKENPHTGYKIVEHRRQVTDEDFIILADKIMKKEIQFLVLQPKLIKDPKIINAAYRLLPLEPALLSFSDFYELIYGKVPLDEVEERWFIENIITRQKVYDALKSLTDFIFSIIGGIIFLPFGILISISIKLTSKGPIFCIQKRVGKNGDIFWLYKFRTMKGCEGGPLWTEENDNRLTNFGRFLRFTHLDEIPQLWNIFRGDISVTGPRPERVELVEKYQSLPYYEMRHVIKPGLTGWAQINFKPSASLEEAKEKLEYDIYYVKNRSFLVDALIILKTIRYIFSRTK